MKLFELIKDKWLASRPFHEMANISPTSTGLPTVICFGEVGGQHEPRIKVSNNKGKFTVSYCFVVSVDKEPRVLTKTTAKLPKSDQDNIIDWIKLNYDNLMLLWQIHETGDAIILHKGTPNEEILDAHDILGRLQKL
ncbi:MAG: hypothetical protein QXN55_01365 [Candidatus Nitrosotenuis sp.]